MLTLTNEETSKIYGGASICFISSYIIRKIAGLTSRFTKRFV